MFEYVVNSRA